MSEADPPPAGCVLVLPLNTFVLVCLLAYFVIFNLSLTWVMFQVMDQF